MMCYDMVQYHGGLLFWFFLVWFDVLCMGLVWVFFHY